ncbi:MAG: cyclophilin-like fold protein [Actinomycetes bacterium]
MDIRLTIGETEFRGTLDDTPAGQDFAALLPLTLTLTDFNDTEKISDLPRRLSTEDGVPAGTAGSAGDLTIYAPWGNLALFYRDFAYSNDLIRLGSLDTGAASRIARIPDGTTVTIQRAG